MIYSGIRQLRFEKTASSLSDIPIRLVQDFMRPTVGNMAQQARMAFQESRFKALQSNYKTVFQKVVRMDPLLQEYDNKAELQEAYKVMIKFSPNIALEPMVVRYFLRMFIQGDGVISEQQVQRLSEAEEKFVGKHSKG